MQPQFRFSPRFFSAVETRTLKVEKAKKKQSDHIFPFFTDAAWWRKTKIFTFFLPLILLLFVLFRGTFFSLFMSWGDSFDKYVYHSLGLFWSQRTKKNERIYKSRWKNRRDWTLLHRTNVHFADAKQRWTTIKKGWIV